MRFLILKVLVLIGACPAWGVIDGEKITITTTYIMTVDGQEGRLTLDKAQYILVSALRQQAGRMGGDSVSAEQLEARLRKIGTAGRSIPQIVDEINLESSRAFDSQLIQQLENGRYSLKWAHSQYKGTAFEVLPDESDVVYRGQLLKLSPKETRLVQLLAKTPEQILSYAEIGEAMNWLRSSSRNSGQYLEQINAKARISAGAPLVKRVSGKGMQLTLTPPPPLPETQNFQFQNRSFAFDGADQLIFQHLLAGKKFDSQLLVSTQEFDQLGLPLNELLSGLVRINKAFEEKFGKRVLRLHADLGPKTYSTYLSENSIADGSWSRSGKTCEHTLTGIQRDRL